MYLTNNEFNSLEYVSKGKEGIIRRVSDGLLAKKLFYFGPLTEHNLEVQYGKASDSFILPIEKLYLDNIYNGYIMQEIKGKNVDEVKFNDLKEVITLLDKVKKDAQVLNNKGIVIHDLQLSNCLFDDKFRFIDTSSYILSSNPDKDQIAITNFYTLNDFFLEILFEEIIPQILKSYLKNNNSKLSLFYDMITNTYEPIFITTFLRELVNTEKVNTIKEFKLKVLNK